MEKLNTSKNRSTQPTKKKANPALYQKGSLVPPAPSAGGMPSQHRTTLTYVMQTLCQSWGEGADLPFPGWEMRLLSPLSCSVDAEREEEVGSSPSQQSQVVFDIGLPSAVIANISVLTQFLLFVQAPQNTWHVRLLVSVEISGKRSDLINLRLLGQLYQVFDPSSL